MNRVGCDTRPGGLGRTGIGLCPVATGQASGNLGAVHGVALDVSCYVYAVEAKRITSRCDPEIRKKTSGKDGKGEKGDAATRTRGFLRSENAITGTYTSENPSPRAAFVPKLRCSLGN